MKASFRSTSQPSASRIASGACAVLGRQAPTCRRLPALFAAFGVQAPGWLIVINITREGELIFDPFCGSGTTGVVAKELGRLLVGAELEGEFCELAGRRIKYAARGSVLREISGQLSASPVT